MNFGKITRIMLMGGGVDLARFAVDITRRDVGVVVFGGKRQLIEFVDSQQGLQLQDFLRSNGIECIESLDINVDKRSECYIDDTTLGISFGAPWLFRKEFIDRFNGKLLNLHNTRLPQDRGGGGFSWQILRENRLGYCVLHQVDSGLDTGDTVQVREFCYPNSCRIPRDYREVCTEQTLLFLREFLESVIEQRDFRATAQEEYFSSYWPRLHTDTHGYVDWSWKVTDLERFVCAFDEPYSGASTFVEGKRVHLRKACVDHNDGSFHPFQSGIVYRKRCGALFVAAVGGTLIIGEVRDNTGRDVIEQIRLGNKFYTPQEYLDKARSYRAVYTPEGLLHEHDSD